MRRTAVALDLNHVTRTASRRLHVALFEIVGVVVKATAGPWSSTGGCVLALYCAPAFMPMPLTVLAIRGLPLCALLVVVSMFVVTSHVYLLPFLGRLRLPPHEAWPCNTPFESRLAARCESNKQRDDSLLNLEGGDRDVVRETLQWGLSSAGTLAGQQVLTR